ncbi:uncharacterized protein MELLADRAFT_95668 [Melampsora larici-populina 98AG31]|uniref:Uncharacterized protein n=1 Tax=Melampsora larici-populina (strain 98AG31 / pathotype 3-4-7) TaxID=747676 RepID=F4SA65_MELLP|nr:uncharacterized protein MELLADRAFT_95668 [Melampsora larici-populina 98AG31]EGF98461.1 hypothetical protein MELLADRAFT_95668 [Melampsora larici-populina 98AG31]
MQPVSITKAAPAAQLASPRLNVGWGLSDGEGSERLWSALDTLVSSGRYSTSQHQADAIDLRAKHYCTSLRHNATVSLTKKRKDAIKRLEEAEAALRNLLDADPAVGGDYFENKWNDQKTRQLDVINETTKEKRERLLILIGLAEELVVAHDRLKAIQNKRRRVRTQADNNNLMALPGSVADVEEQIEAIADELGGVEFRNLAGAARNQRDALLGTSLALGKLYEAKVGLTEARLRRHRHTGARQQQYMAKHLGDRTRDVRVKYATYQRRVEKYRTEFPEAVQPDLPDLAKVMGMDMDNPFWNRGEITPKDRAAGERDRLGIESFLSQRSSREDLRRIAREVRQMTGWANGYFDCVVGLKHRGDLEGCGSLKNRLMSLYNIVSRKACKLWKKWSKDLKQALVDTRTCLQGTGEQDQVLKEKFDKVSKWADKEWKTMAGKPVIQAEEPDEYENAEEEEYERWYDMHGEMI